MKTGNHKIKIMIVDDESLIVALLCDFFSKHDQIRVISVAYDGDEVPKVLEQSGELPDVILVDLQMKRMNGIDCINQLKAAYPEIKIIVITSHYQRNFMGYMMKLGVHAFLPKGILPQQLANAVCDVFEKGFFFLEEQIDAMRMQLRTNIPEPVFSSEKALSVREIEVLQLICQQYSTEQIADKLFITKRTVEGHRSNLLLKTSAKNSAGLVIYAIRKKLIDIDQCLWSDLSRP
jgi:DNA-binding NarL/FixJ family response regulator